MGRRKRAELAEKPLNIRLYEESYRDIKVIAEREGVPDSDVHRELVAEALLARRERASDEVTEPAGKELISSLARVEKLLMELTGAGILSLQDEVQTLSSRVSYLSDQVAILLTSSPKRPKAQAKKDGMLFS
jgi:hypothetical protein